MDTEKLQKMTEGLTKLAEFIDLMKEGLKEIENSDPESFDAFLDDIRSEEVDEIESIASDINSACEEAGSQISSIQSSAGDLESIVSRLRRKIDEQKDR